MNISRRRFILNGSRVIGTPFLIKALGSLSALELLVEGHAQEKELSGVYSRLKGQKIQVPENGCYIGFYNEGNVPTLDDNEKRIKFIPTFGKRPKILIAPLHTQDWLEFPIKYVNMIDSIGSIPYIYSGMRGYIKEFGGFRGLAENSDFGKSLEKYAKSLRECGKPIFFTTMRELNGDWFPWGNKPDTAKKTWRFMHKVFEDNGANEYATWVWEVMCPFSHKVDGPERYYPGNDVVDWIGLSSYYRSQFIDNHGSFESQVGPTYREMKQKHNDKPIMMAEFAHTNESGQVSWLKGAFDTIKSWPGMKAAIFWNNINRHLPDDHTLNDDSINYYKEIARDPYFIWGSK